MKEIQNLPTSNYSIVETSDGLFRIIKDGQSLLNPHGYEVPAVGLMAAKQAVEELKAGADYTAHNSMLMYIYTFGEYMQTPDYLPKEVANIADWIQDHIFSDPYLMLFQDSPSSHAIGSFYANELPVAFGQLTPLQQTGVLSFNCCFNSFALPYLINYRILDALEDDMSNFEELKNEFLEDVRNWLMENESDDIDDYNMDSYREFLKEQMKDSMTDKEMEANIKQVTQEVLDRIEKRRQLLKNLRTGIDTYVVFMSMK